MFEQSQRQQQVAQKQSPEGSDSNVRKLSPPPFQLKANPIQMKESEEEEVVSASAETVQMFADASESGTNQPNNVVQKKDAAASGAPGITADGVPAEFIEHLKLREGWRTEVSPPRKTSNTKLATRCRMTFSMGGR
jgi:hypothetical protein